MWGLLALLLAIGLLGSALAGGSALAARGGNHTTVGTTSKLAFFQSGAQVSSVAVGTAFELHGSGFGANQTVYVGPQGYFALTPVTTDGGGNFSLTYASGISVPGSYTFIAMVYSQKSWVIQASATLIVT